MGEWLHHYLPAVPPEFGNAGTCWIARMKTRRAEHNPPFYWLGRALDVVAEAGAHDAMGARLEAAHGDALCSPGDGRDDRVQGVLSEACGFAWTHTHIGTPRIEATTPGGSVEGGPIWLHVPDHETYVFATRLRTGPRGGDLFADVATLAAQADDVLPDAPGRVLYLDMLYSREYPQGAGYDLGLTEPVEAALHHYGGEAHLGHVFTRPFQWGNPVAAHY